jgi:predicted CoA-binding protein
MESKAVLTTSKTVAIVGLSDKPDKPSYEVGLYLKSHGYNIIPVNPNVTSVFGLESYPSILAIPKAIKIDVVDIFRQPDQVIPIIKEVITSGQRPVIWMQEGVGSPEAKTFAEKNGLEVAMNMCMMKEYKASSQQ